MEGLTASDRCDRCGAQALVVTGHERYVLMWCGHHFTKNEHLFTVAQILHDERIPAH